MPKNNRRNFLKTAVITLLFWAALVLLTTQTLPDNPLNIALFFLLAFWALLLPLSIVFANSRRGLILTFGILGTLSLKPLGMFTLLSAGAWWLIILLIEFWFSTRKRH